MFRNLATYSTSLVLFTVGVLKLSPPEKGQKFNRLIPMSTWRFTKYPSPRKLGIGVLGYLLIDIGVQTARAIEIYYLS